jgi:hypothetical protein
MNGSRTPKIMHAFEIERVLGVSAKLLTKAA